MFPRSALLLAALAAWPGIAAAQKTDVVTMPNGDRITGEVQGLSRGKLDYKTDDLGRISIEWVKLTRLTSVHYFDVEVASGVRYFGRLVEPATDGVIVVQDVRTDTLPISSVVGIKPLSAGFLQRVTAYLDVGFSLAKANQATTLSIDTEAEYRGSKLGADIAYNLYVQGQENSPTTSRSALKTRVDRFLPRRWSASAIAQLEQNDELNLDYRFIGGLGGGRILRQSNSYEIEGSLGLVVTEEQFFPEDSTSTPDPATNLEGLLHLGWNAFRFDTPKLDFSIALTAYPSLSDFGRVRSNLDLRLKYEVFKDFNVGVSFTDTFDSRPPEGSSNNDFVTSVTIGWSYRR